MQIGVFDHLDKNDLPLSKYYEARLQIIERYDRAGLHSYHCAEHHLTPIGMAPSPSVFLAAVAQRTRALRFGPMIFTTPIYHPLRLMEEICMLDQMSGGRLEIGFGRGASAAELRYFGADPKQAQHDHDRNLAFVLDALSSGSVTIETDYGTRSMPLQIEPMQRPHPPLWYGVHSVESAERAARKGLNLVSLDTPAETRQYVDRYRAIENEVRRSHVAISKIGLSNFVVVGQDDGVAMAIARRAYARWHQSFYYASRLHGYEIALMRPAEFDEMLRLGKAIAGSPDTISRVLSERLAESGANFFVGQFAFGDLSLAETLESVDLFARHVMPVLSAIDPSNEARIA
ncbi:MAG: LLM class flavin-dependent oxidoreductase [Burkholderiales bacterium]